MPQDVTHGRDSGQAQAQGPRELSSWHVGEEGAGHILMILRFILALA